MHTFEIEGVEHTIDCNAFTPFVYAEEFTVTRKGKEVPEDINAAVAEVMNFVTENDMPPMLKMLQFFWAFEKTTNAKLPGFKSWLKSLPRSVMALDEKEGWAAAVMAEINEAFFPSLSKSDVAPEA